MVVAGSPSVPRRFPCVPANAAPVLTRQEQQSPRAGSQLPAVLRELHLPMAPSAAAPSAAGRAGKRPAPELPSNMQNTNPKTSQWGRSSPRIFWKAESAAAPQLPKQWISGFQLEDFWLSITPIPAPQLRVLPSVHAPEHLVDDEGVRALSAGHPRVSFGIFLTRAPGTRVIFALLGHRDNKAPVKSSAGSKTAQSQEDKEY